MQNYQKKVKYTYYTLLRLRNEYIIHYCMAYMNCLHRSRSLVM